jgi:ribosomal protein L23
MGIIKNPVTSEKAVRLMSSENKLLFDVEFGASRSEIKGAVEKLFNVKVVKVNTFIDREGRKRAYVKLSAENPAGDIATNLGMI